MAAPSWNIYRFWCWEPSRDLRSDKMAANSWNIDRYQLTISSDKPHKMAAHSWNIDRYQLTTIIGDMTDKMASLLEYRQVSADYIPSVVINQKRWRLSPGK
jgi:hypothetical protein